MHVCMYMYTCILCVNMQIRIFANANLEIYINIDAEKLKLVQSLPFLKLKLVQFFKILFTLQIEEYFFKKNKTQKQFYKFKIGPILLCNILGPIFNFDLAQCLTLKSCHFCFFGG